MMSVMRQGAGDGETILADAKWLQEVFQQHFTGMDVFQAFHGGSKEVVGRQGEMGRELADMSGG